MSPHVGPFASQAELLNTDPHDREQQLVARIREGDERAFEELFTTYFPSLCNFVRSYVGTPDQAEELVQGVFLRIWQHRVEWHPASVRAYLFSASRNSAINAQRHERIVVHFEEQAVREDLVVGAGRPPAQPDAQVQLSELTEALRRAVHALPERRRQVVILRWEHQLTQAEIAQVLGISIRTVETQLARAMVSLRERLAPFRR